MIRGAEVNSEVASLCPEGVLALQGNLQPVGKVVCILEEKTRVRFPVAHTQYIPFLYVRALRPCLGRLLRKCHAVVVAAAVQRFCRSYDDLS